MSWNKFKIAVKVARETPYVEGIRLQTSVEVKRRVKGVKEIFSLNPYRINLRTGFYGPSRDLITGEMRRIEDVREIVKEMFKGDEQ